MPLHIASGAADQTEAGKIRHAAHGQHPPIESLPGRCRTPQRKPLFRASATPARAAPTTATDAHLEALLAAWPQLSEEMRAAVRAMVEAAV